MTSKTASKKPAAKSTVSATATSLKASTNKALKKLFILDTNVLMHDPSSIYRFEEHDIFIPMMTLEELDNNKKGMTEVARNARQVSRTLDEIISGQVDKISQGIDLLEPSNELATGKLFVQSQSIPVVLPEGLPTGRGDNQILAVVIHLDQHLLTHQVVLVSKDINMRIKARALSLDAEDYFNDQVIDDADLLYPGCTEIDDKFWEANSRGMESWKEDGRSYYRISGSSAQSLQLNEFVYQPGLQEMEARVKERQGKKLLLETIIDYTHHKNEVWGITARNREQNFALNLLMNPEIHFVSLLGQAGTGKTLLTLAAGLEQVFESKRYTEIIMTRVTVPVGEDIGFLPGTEEEKMAPWMGALEDNLEVLNGSSEGNQWARDRTRDFIGTRIKVKSLNFMRGRTFLRKYLIIDEAQNLTPKQMKTLITRAGPETKVICLGNIAQIDTPYLTEGSSGLTYVVDRFKNWQHAGHITLQRGERSLLADYANEVL